MLTGNGYDLTGDGKVGDGSILHRVGVRERLLVGLSSTLAKCLIV